MGFIESGAHQHKLRDLRSDNQAVDNYDGGKLSSMIAHKLFSSFVSYFVVQQRFAYNPAFIASILIFKFRRQSADL